MTRVAVAYVSPALATRDAVLRGLYLEQYDPTADRDRPAAFIGVYMGADLAAIAQHRGLAVVKLCGGDVRAAHWMAGALNALPRPRVRVLAGLPLRADCERHGLRVDLWRNVYIGDPGLFWPFDPPGRRVYTYCPRARAEEYGIATIRAVAEALPGVEFYIARWGVKDVENLVGMGRGVVPFAGAIPLPDWIAPEQLVEVLAGCCCAIRTVPHDGFSVGAVEAAMTGRPVAHVADMGVPWIEHAPTVNALVAFVRRCIEAPAVRQDLAAAARKLAEDDSWLFFDKAGVDVVACAS